MSNEEGPVDQQRELPKRLMKPTASDDPEVAKTITPLDKAIGGFALLVLVGVVGFVFNLWKTEEPLYTITQAVFWFAIIVFALIYCVQLGKYTDD